MDGIIPFKNEAIMLRAAPVAEQIGSEVTAFVEKPEISSATAPVSNSTVGQIQWLLIASTGILTLCLIAICIVSSQLGALTTAADAGLGITYNLRSLLDEETFASNETQPDLQSAAVDTVRLLGSIRDRTAYISWLIPELTRNVAATEKLWQAMQPDLLAISAGDPLPRSHIKQSMPALTSAWQDLETSLTDAGTTARLSFSGVAGLLCVLLLIGFVTGSFYSDSVLSGARYCMRGLIAEVRAAGSFTAVQPGPRPSLEEMPEAVAELSRELHGLVRLMDGNRQILAKALDCVPAGAVILSDDWKIQTANRYSSKLLGLTPDALQHRTLQEVLPSASSLRDKVAGLGARSWVDQAALIQDVDRGKNLSLHLTQVPTIDGQSRIFVLLIGEAGDPAQPTATDYEQLYEKILESISDAVFLVDQNGVVLDLNQQAAAICGYSREELVRTRIQNLEPRPSADKVFSLDSYLRSPDWKLDRAVVKTEVARKDGSSFSAELCFAKFGMERRAAYLVKLKDSTSDELAVLFSQDKMRIIEMIARSEKPEQVLLWVVTMIEHQVPGARCVVDLRCSGRLPLLTAPSLSEELVKSVYEFQTEVDFNQRLHEGLGPTAQGDDFRKTTVIPGMQSVFSASIFSSQGMVIGTIDVHRPEYRRPSTAEIELFRLASRFASVSIEQSELNSELAYRAQHDALTGLLNRASFEQRMGQAIAHASRYLRRVAILSLDLDRFKIINDMLGHAAGDELIMQLAQRLSSCVRETDFVARWGGDEFVIGLPEITEPRDAHKTAAKLLDTLKTPFQLAGREITTTASIGVSVFPDDGPDLETLIRRADTAMYRTKKNGRNGFHCYNAGMGEMDRRRLEMEANLRVALERDEFSLSYQPQVDARDGSLGGLEALLRWHSTDLGPIPPSTFIPIAEESGSIIQIGNWVVRQACRQIKEFERAGCGQIRIAVNVSGIQFSRNDFVDVVARAIEGANIDSRLLELELTESFLMEACNGADVRMEKLRALGVKISIDDFGTGFSSLSSLHRLPIDCLKIDQSFVRGLGESPRAPVFVGSIITLAKSLGILTIAEGVESTEQLDILREGGCDLMQGYLLGMPLSRNQITSKLLSQPAGGTWCSRLVPAQRPRKNIETVSIRQQYAGVA